jgi:hypothetical protein
MNKLTFIVALVGAIINSSVCVVAQAAKNSSRDLSSSSSFSADKLNKFQRSVQQESDSSSNIATALDNNETSTEEIETEEEEDHHDDHHDEDNHSPADASCHCDGDVVHCATGIGEDFCSCTTDGILECEGIKIVMVKDDIRDVAVYGKPWAEVIITSLIVNLSTLAGVFGTLI